MLRIGIDTGGTFTDFVVLHDGQLTIFKLPSTPGHAERAVIEGLSRSVQNEDRFIVQHGSTVATNALLERRGAKTLLLTTQGFEDVLEIGRQNRPALYSLTASRPQPLVDAGYRIGVKERSAWDGSSILSLEKKSLDWIKNKVKQLSPEAIAVVLLYSYVNPENENRIAEALQDAEIPISLSHQVLPEFREFERTSATVMNAYLTPVTYSYLKALSQNELMQKGHLTVMQSNGGTISAQKAASNPVRTLFSGPAGGVVGAFQLAREAGYSQILTFDMGGTSTDVCLCDGQISTTSEASIDHYPVPVQMIGLHSVGAGGGSIAWMDSGNLLRVGPHSAGADPGPVCYGKGDDVTVTDANIFLGLLDPDWFLGGEFQLSPDRIRPALEDLGRQLQEKSGREWKLTEIAEGIRKIVHTQMESALRLISLERGYDTRDFTLVSFGGAGGLHACDLARALLIPRVLVPANPGVLSSLGILRADVVKDTSLTVLLHSGEEELDRLLRERFQPLQQEIEEQLLSEGFSDDQARYERSLDVRYAGQSFEINVPFAENFSKSFHEKHLQFYGYSNPDLPIEIVTLRAKGSGRFDEIQIPALPLESEVPEQDALIQEKQVTFHNQAIPTRFYIRSKLRPGNRLRGSAVILEYSSTTYIPADFQARVDERMNVIIEPLANISPTGF